MGTWGHAEWLFVGAPRIHRMSGLNRAMQVHGAVEVVQCRSHYGIVMSWGQECITSGMFVGLKCALFDVLFGCVGLCGGLLCMGVCMWIVVLAKC